MKNENAKKTMLARAYNKYYTILVSKLKERSFPFGEKDRLKYLLFKNARSDTLIVGFQAWNANGARYNYVSTVKGFRASKLFIKDDFASNGLGDYYLGKNGTFSVERAVFDLIDQTVKELHIRRLFFIGSSKGAYAAVNFGVRYPDACIIAAAPQYRLGQYLSTIRKYRPALEDVLGENITEETIAMLDHRLEDKLKNDPYAASQTLCIHYSVNEDGYDAHIHPLLEDVKSAGLSMVEDVETYEHHWELKFFFPAFLNQTLEQRGVCK